MINSLDSTTLPFNSESLGFFFGGRISFFIFSPVRLRAVLSAKSARRCKKKW